MRCALSAPTRHFRRWAKVKARTAFVTWNKKTPFDKIEIKSTCFLLASTSPFRPAEHLPRSVRMPRMLAPTPLPAPQEKPPHSSLVISTPEIRYHRAPTHSLLPRQCCMKPGAKIPRSRQRPSRTRAGPNTPTIQLLLLQRLRVSQPPIDRQ